MFFLATTFARAANKARDNKKQILSFIDRKSACCFGYHAAAGETCGSYFVRGR
jgi:hypothetical protein